MSSFHSGEHKKQKLKYPGNFPYSAEQEHIKNGHGKEGYIKAEQFYYFDRDKIDFYVLGNMEPALFNELLAYIQTLDEIENIVDNL